MGLNNISADCQAKTGTAGNSAARALHPKEPFKHPVNIGGRNPGTAVLKKDLYPVACGLATDPQLAIRIGIFQGITQQVIKELLQPFRIGKKSQFSRGRNIYHHCNIFFGKLRPELICGMIETCAAIDLLFSIGQGTYVRLGKLEEIIYQPVQPHYFSMQ